jgi:hypothetical protein
LEELRCSSIGDCITASGTSISGIVYIGNKRWAIKRHGGNTCLEKGASLKRLHTLLPHLYDILEMEILWWQEKDQ